MFEKLPQRYESCSDEWQIELKSSKKATSAIAKKAARKIWWNYDNESRVPPRTRNAFFAKLSGCDRTKGRKVLKDCIDDTMVLRGPAPKGQLPDAFARAVTTKTLAKDATRKLKTTINKATALRWLNKGTMIKFLPDEIHNPLGFVWIADQKEVEKICAEHDADELCRRLGMYHLHIGDEVAIMTIPSRAIELTKKSGTRPRLFIPTVLDGGDNPAFTPAQKGETHCGWLIDLRTGDVTIPEWVCGKLTTREGVGFLADWIKDPDRIKITSRPPTGFLKKYDKIVSGAKK